MSRNGGSSWPSIAAVNAGRTSSVVSRWARSLRVTLISFLWDRLGGAVAVPQRLSAELVERGYEVTVISSRRRGGLSVDKENGLTHYRFRPANLFWVGNKESRSPILRAIWQVVDMWNPHVYHVVGRILRQVDADIVHIHKLRGLSPSVWQAARRAGVRAVVQTCHDYELISPVGMLKGKIGRWAREGAPLLRPYQLLRARASRAVDLVTAPSRYLLDTISARGMFSSAESHVIPNFHDLSPSQIRRKETKHSEHSGRLRLLYLGRLERDKGVPLLLDAVRNVGGECELTIAGWGAAEPLVREAVRKDGRIRFVGVVREAERQRLLSGSDAVIVPSAVDETFGLTVVEAYARGTPVIASRVGALPSVVRDGVTGRLFNCGDESALIALIERFIRSPGELAAMRAACLDVAMDYTAERIVPRYLEIYTQALAARGDGTPSG